MNRSTGTSQQQKKTYSRPVLRQVPLRPEEAILGGCKTATTNGPNYSTAGALACGGGLLATCSALTS
jgi:hypothetical protein